MAGNQGVATENINEVILRLLRLESGTEIDYQTYFERIKKKLASHRLVGNQLPIEEQNLLEEELKRVWKIKDRTNKRVKIKQKKVKVSGATPQSSRKDPSGGPPKDKDGNFPKTGAIVKSTKGKLSTEKFFYQPKVEKVNVRDITEKTTKVTKQKKPTCCEQIGKKLDSILKTLTNINDFDKKQSEKERKNRETQSRQEREKSLETSPFSGIKKAFAAITKPFQSIFDRIIKYITTIIFGRILVKLINWIADPKNQGKIKSLIRFFKDWWPALLGGYVLFGTTFGKLVRSTTGIVGRFIFQIGKVAIPQLLKFIKTPIGAGIALFTAGATVPAIFPGTVNEKERETKKAPGTAEDKIRQLQQQKANLNLFEKLQNKGSEIDEQISFIQSGKTKAYGFSSGGFASGFNLSSGVVKGKKGTDKVPAMLTDGEFVMSVGAVNKYGVDTLEAMNASGGGTNNPTITNGVTYAATGGRIGSGDYGGSNKDPLYQVDKFFDNFFGRDIDIRDPRTWPPKGSGGGYDQGNRRGGGGSNTSGLLPEIGREINRAKELAGQGINSAGREINRAKELAGDTYNRIINDPYVKQGIDAAKQVYNKSAKFVGGLKDGAVNYGIKEGYLSKRGRFEGAAKSQATNFLSDMLPNLPGISTANKALTENYLTKIGMGRSTRNINKKGENFTSAFYGGASGIDRAYNVGQLQVNKMSNESRAYYLKKVKAGLAAGTLKSGDMIDAYDLDSKNPIRREQGTVRFFVGPDGSPYLMDTYGFDPQKGGKGKNQINLGSAQAEYDKQLKTFQDDSKGIKSLGWWAKKFNLKPLADATEGGPKVQFALSLRNKIFGYDPEREAMSKLAMRFKTKVQVDDLRKYMKPEEIKMLLSLGKEQLQSNQRAALNEANRRNEKDVKRQKEEQKKALNQKALEAKRPWWDKMGVFGGSSAAIQRQQRKQAEDFANSGGYGRYAPSSLPKNKNQPYGPGGDPRGTGRGQSQRTTNQQRLEAKRPWWDKMGAFGGGSRIAQQQAKKAQIAKAKPVSKAPPGPVKSNGPKTVVVKTNSSSRRSSGSSRQTTQNVPNFSPKHPKPVVKSVSAYGIYR